MKSLLRILGTVIAVVAVSALVAYVADDVGTGLLALFVIPVGILACIFLYGLILQFIDAARGVKRVSGKAAKAAHRGIYAVSGFNVSAALRRVSERWKESE